MPPEAVGRCLVVSGWECAIRLRIEESGLCSFGLANYGYVGCWRTRMGDAGVDGRGLLLAYVGFENTH